MSNENHCISRRNFLIHSSAAVASSALISPSALAQQQANKASKPNIIFIIVDDMGWADLGCYGQTAYQTPNLDRLAAEGIRFEQAYSGCTVCAPARSTLMMGTHMGHTSVRGNTGGIPLRSSDRTIASTLKEQGYACGGFGKWGLGDLDTEGTPEKHGFDEFFGYYHQIHAHYFYPDYLIDTGKKHPLPGNQHFYQRHGDERGGMPDGAEGDQYQFSHYLIFERMQQFIRNHQDEPFFCYAPWTPPHARYEMPANDPAWQAVKDNDWPVDAKVHAAFNMMVDRHVGEVMALLEELQIDQNTIVFFCSDNGASKRFEGVLDSSGPLTGRKRSMHEGGIRVPLIARWPGTIAAGQVSQLPTYFPDVYPTLAHLADPHFQAPDSIDGLSIVPTLMGRSEEQPTHDYLYWEWPTYNWREREYTGLMQAVRHGEWKMLRHNNSDPWQLYHLPSDQAETNSLADQHPDRVQALSEWVNANREEMRPQIEPKKPEGKRYR